MGFFGRNQNLSKCTVKRGHGWLEDLKYFQFRQIFTMFVYQRGPATKEGEG